MTTIDDCRIIDLPKIEEPKGNLSLIEDNKQIPFEIKRVYWIYDVPGGYDRGEHAFRENQELIVALSGAFDVIIDDGSRKVTYSLNRSYKGLYVPRGMWRRMTNFSTNSLALVLASTDFTDDDYIRDYEEFKLWRQEQAEVSEDATHTGNTGGTETDNPRKPNVFDCSLLELVRNHDVEGNLTYVYPNVHVPFPVRRVFYSYDIPGGEDRGAHAHRECHQLIVAASGAFEVVLDDGVNKRTVTLNRPFWGLHVPPGVWASEQGFSSGSICLVLASHAYDEQDYIRDYEEFQKYREEG